MDEIMKIVGRKTESIAKYYIGGTFSGQVLGSKKIRSQTFANASELPLSPEFRKNFAACAGERTELMLKKFGRGNSALDQWSPTNIECNLNEAQQSTGGTTGRRRRPHPIQHLHEMINDRKAEYKRKKIGLEMRSPKSSIFGAKSDDLGHQIFKSTK